MLKIVMTVALPMVMDAAALVLSNLALIVAKEVSLQEIIAMPCVVMEFQLGITAMMET